MLRSLTLLLAGCMLLSTGASAVAEESSAPTAGEPAAQAATGWQGIPVPDDAQLKDLYKVFEYRGDQQEGYLVSPDLLESSLHWEDFAGEELCYIQIEIDRQAKDFLEFSGDATISWGPKEAPTERRIHSDWAPRMVRMSGFTIETLPLLVCDASSITFLKEGNRPDTTVHSVLTPAELWEIMHQDSNVTVTLHGKEDYEQTYGSAEKGAFRKMLVYWAAIKSGKITVMGIPTGA